MRLTILIMFIAVFSAGSRELGKLITDHYVETIVRNLRLIKNDEKTLQLQNEFYERIDKGFR